jgi:hypothetical protein
MQTISPNGNWHMSERPALIRLPVLGANLKHHVATTSKSEIADGGIQRKFSAVVNSH